MRRTPAPLLLKTAFYLDIRRPAVPAKPKARSSTDHKKNREVGGSAAGVLRVGVCTTTAGGEIPREIPEIPSSRRRWRARSGMLVANALNDSEVMMVTKWAINTIMMVPLKPAFPTTQPTRK